MDAEAQHERAHELYVSGTADEDPDAQYRRRIAAAAAMWLNTKGDTEAAQRFVEMAERDAPQNL